MASSKLKKELNRFTDPTENTVRDVMKDRMRYLLAGYHKIDVLEVDADLVATLTDEAFSVCGIPVKEQDEEW
jgi:hypothetical protein